MRATGNRGEALADFTRALERDPKMATGYVNRGYVLNDLHEAAKAVKDFQTALQLQPDYGEAHLGLAFADLQLHRPRPALIQLDTAQKLLGKSHEWHLARAEAFRQEQDFAHAETEYRAALQEKPNDLTTQLAFADTLYHMRRYAEAIEALDVAPSCPRRIQRSTLCERRSMPGKGSGNRRFAISKWPSNTATARWTSWWRPADALLTLGDRDAAMQRFSRALDAPSGDRIGVRLAVAQSISAARDVAMTPGARSL